MIPPEEDAEFAACIAEVLETHGRPYGAERPVVCMNEQPVQLVKETRAPLAATREHPERVDYEYERAGTAAVFLFCEPLRGWRMATARERRTKTDWALEVAASLEGRYAGCEKGDFGAGQSQDAHRGSLLRGVRAGPGEGPGAAHRVLLLAEARQLAENRGITNSTR